MFTTGAANKQIRKKPKHYKIPTKQPPEDQRAFTCAKCSLSSLCACYADHHTLLCMLTAAIGMLKGKKAQLHLSITAQGIKERDKKQQICRKRVFTWFTCSNLICWQRWWEEGAPNRDVREEKRTLTYESTLTNKCYCLLVKDKRQQYLSYSCLKEVTWMPSLSTFLFLTLFHYEEHSSNNLS